MLSKTFIGILALAASASLVGCVSKGDPGPEPGVESPSSKASAFASLRDAGVLRGGSCPLQLPGTTMAWTDSDGGVALDFVTTGNVAELRQRVRRVAELNNQRPIVGSIPMDAGMPIDGGMPMGHHHGTMMAGRMMGGGMMGGGMMIDRGLMTRDGLMMPASTSSTEEIQAGERIVMRPVDPARLDALRQHVRRHAERMASGDCPMMSTAAESQAPSLPGDGGSARDWYRNASSPR